MIRPLRADKLFHDVLLRVPAELIQKIDAYAAANGIKTRTKAIINILYSALA